MINIKMLTHELIDALTRHGGYTGLSSQECEDRVRAALAHCGVCTCQGFTSAATVETVAETVVAKPVPARKPRPSK